MSQSERTIARRALEVEQVAGEPLYVFTLTAAELLEVADISRVTRGKGGELLGYQRPEVRQHVNEIVEYLDGDSPLFPNSIIMALPSTVRFKGSRGPNVSDGLAAAGTLEIPMPGPSDPKPGWIVDGQQRTLALSRAKNQDFPVLVTAFIADTIDRQRDQFVRINNSRPLPTGLVTELLPEVSTPISRRLSARRLPSALVDLLNGREESPFHGLIRRPSVDADSRKRAVVTDTALVKAIEESLNSPSGCLFPYRNIATGETDTDALFAILLVYWNGVRQTFPSAWGKPPTKSRLMHGAGVRAMGRVMDRVMTTVDPFDDAAVDRVVAQLAPLVDVCRWTSGTWGEPLGIGWNEIENTPRHIKVLSNYLVRVLLTAQPRHGGPGL